MHNYPTLYLPAQFFLVRCASYPIDCFFSLSQSSDGTDLKNRYLNDPHFRQALAFSSQSLSSQIRAGKIDKAVTRALYKYFSRISTRGTPFGLLSFVSWGSAADSVRSKLKTHLLKKRARPDMGWLHNYIDTLINKSLSIMDLSVENNPIISKRINRYIVTYLIDKKENASVSIKKNPITDFIFLTCKSSIKVKELVKLIQKRFPQVNVEKTIEVIRLLINQQFLWCTLYPSVTNFLPLSNLIKQVPESIKPSIKDLSKKIEIYNRLPIQESEEFLYKVTDEMSQKAASRRLPLQVDFGIPNKQIELPFEILKQVAKSAEILWKLNALKEQQVSLNKYHTKFLKKFGQRRLVAINELLDPIIGLGSPEYDLANPRLSESSELSQYYQWLGLALSKALKNQESEIVIDDRRISELVPNSDLSRAGTSMDVFFEVCASSVEDLNVGKYQVLINNFVSTGGATFGRFMDLLSPDLGHQLKAFSKEESDLEKDTVFIEAFYLPQSSNVQNVAISPSFRSIKLDLSPGADSSMLLKDIYVGATKDFLYFTDKKGSKDFRFISTNVLVPSHAPEQLRFMLEVTQQRSSRMRLWPWGTYSSHTYLPRVRYKQTILSPQRWMVTLSCIDAHMSNSIEVISQKLKKWIHDWQLPKYVFITEGDNRLLINSSFNEHILIAASFLKKKEKIFLIEKIKQDKGDWVESDLGRHSTEFVLPIMKNPAYANKKRSIPQVAFQKVAISDRCKEPGSEWLYYKFFLSSEIEGEFLQQNLAPFANQLLDKKNIQSWFFIRYQENDRYEIRFRMKISPEFSVLRTVEYANDFARNSLERNVIQDFSISLYEREVERYGGLDFIDLCEKLFCEDSYLTLQLLEFVSEELPSYVIGALSVVDILDHLFGESSIAHEFFNRIDLDKSALLGYRKWRQVIESGFFKHFGSIGENRAAILKQIRQKAKKMEPIPSVNLYSLASSIVHMHCNRLCGINPNLEAIVKAYAAHFTKNSLIKKSLRIGKSETIFSEPYC